jgi:predicted phage terminase large subunit-like protein
MAFEAGFLSFATTALAAVDLAPAAHHRLLISKLEDVAAGRCDRLMVQMPPGSAKSTFGSVLFPAYFFSCHPGQQIIATAHTASLAAYFGRRTRAVIMEQGPALGLKLRTQSRAAGEFSLDSGGEYFAAGVRGPITGRRADLILIDDPIKSWAEAESEVARGALYDWYRAELIARLKPNGRVVLMMTRWHQDDLAGQLLRDNDEWTCLKLPALSVGQDALNRPVGAALWPEWQDETALARRKLEVGERAFAAMYQQTPQPADSAIFNMKNIPILAEAPPVVRAVRAWDLAATVAAAGKNPDYTVGLKLGLMAGGALVVLDVIRRRGGPGEVEALMIGTARNDGFTTMVSVPQDPGQAGVAQIATLRTKMSGYQIHATPEQGSKTLRANLAAIQIDNGNLTLVAAPWNDSFLSELAAFPGAAKDDQVDALSRAVNAMATTRGQPARMMTIPMIGR